jgi:iduronate 2-sulfatase
MRPRVNKFIAILGWLFLFQVSESTGSERMNVLFIAADDLRNDLGCYGHPMVKTPNLDRLAERGLVFNHAYCQQAVCNPSRSSIMTGQRLDTLRVWDLPTHFRTHAPDAVTLPQHFKNHGYFTQNVGKIFHNWIHEIKGDPVSWSVPAEMHFASHRTDDAIVEGKLPPSSTRFRTCECRDVPDDAYFDGRVANLAVDALKTLHKQDQPFFLAVGFWKPHSPFNAPKRYWDLYQRDQVDLPRNPEWPQDAPRIAWHDSREVLGSGNKAASISDADVREIRHGYLANISYMDAQIGRVLDELDRLKLTDKTVIVFWSDHGYHLGEHSLFAKTSNFELDARVPLIVATPKMATAGRTTNALAELMDIYPTLTDLCGLPSQADVEGVSLVPVLKQPETTVRTAALTQHPRPAYFDREATKSPTHMGYSIRTETYRYTEWRDWKTGETFAIELYDHAADPDETVNLANESKSKSIVEQHAVLLDTMEPCVTPGWTPLLP